jgi:protoporphyrinogen IX oxidase
MSQVLHPNLFAFHIIFVVSWFAGLFYLVRLFIYHTEASEKQEPERSILLSHFRKAESNLLNVITWPAMVATYLFGFWMAIATYEYYFYQPWFYIKLAFVLGLTWYHIQCVIMHNRMKKNIFRYSSFKLRLWNEVATLFLVTIVFIVVYREQGNPIWGIIGFILLSVLLYFGVQLYKKLRKK